MVEGPGVVLLLAVVFGVDAANLDVLAAAVTADKRTGAIGGAAVNVAIVNGFDE